MTSMPASRSARAITFAPRSCPSSPGLATSTRIFCSVMDSLKHRRSEEGPGCQVLGLKCQFSDLRCNNSKIVDRKSTINNQQSTIKNVPYIVFTSKLRHKYQHAIDR